MERIKKVYIIRMIQTIKFPSITVLTSQTMPAASKIIDRPLNWLEIKYIIDTNDLDKFARSLDETQRYHQFKEELKRGKTTIYKHLLIKELEWANPQDYLMSDLEIAKTVESKGEYIFTCSEDLKIIPNHFPYFFEKGIKHYCIWTKIRIPSDYTHPLGDLSKPIRKAIDTYVNKTFNHFGISSDRIVWFRNWEALQSVKELSHIHIIIKDCTQQEEDRFLYTSGVPLTIKEYTDIVN